MNRKNVLAIRQAFERIEQIKRAREAQQQPKPQPARPVAVVRGCPCPPAYKYYQKLPEGRWILVCRYHGVVAA